MRWLTLLLLVASACGSDFTPYEEIDAPRVLALRAREPEIQYGEVTVIDALTTEPPTSFEWSWCPFAATAAGAYECLVDEAQTSAALGVPVSFALGGNATADLEDIAPPEALEALCAALLTVELPSDTVQPDCDGGIDVSVRLTARWDDFTIVSLKNVRWVWTPLDEATRHRNPATVPLFSRLAGSQLPLDGLLTVAHDIDVDFIAELDDAQASPLTISWFVTTGDLDPPRESFIPDERDVAEARDVTWTSPLATRFREGNVDVYAVIRDDRGGVSWSRGAIRVGAQ